MKLGPVTKLDKGNKTTSKKFGDDVMSANFFNLWPIWSNPELDSGGTVCKTYIFINSNLLSYKN